MLCWVIDLLQRARDNLLPYLVLYVRVHPFGWIAYYVKQDHDFEIMFYICIYMIYIYTILLILIFSNKHVRVSSKCVAWTTINFFLLNILQISGNIAKYFLVLGEYSI